MVILIPNIFTFIGEMLKNAKNLTTNFLQKAGNPILKSLQITPKV